MCMCEDCECKMELSFIKKLHDEADKTGVSQGYTVTAHPGVPFTYWRSISTDDLKKTTYKKEN